jgi:hypothetical protein
MIITQISEIFTWPNTNETRTDSEFDTMQATSHIATRAMMTRATARLRFGALRDP